MAEKEEIYVTQTMVIHHNVDVILSIDLSPCVCLHVSNHVTLTVLLQLNILCLIHANPL